MLQLIVDRPKILSGQITSLQYITAHSDGKCAGVLAKYFRAACDLLHTLLSSY